jgi:hypothetical protein
MVLTLSTFHILLEKLLYLYISMVTSYLLSELYADYCRGFI